MTVKGYEVSLGGNKSVLKLNCVHFMVGELNFKGKKCTF